MKRRHPFGEETFGRHARSRRALAAVTRAAVLLFSTAAAASSQTGAIPASEKPSAPHDKAFWRHVIESNYAVPEGAAVPALIEELNSYLGSPDPELRDDITYSITANWIYRKRLLSPDALRRLERVWTANLRKGIGEQNTDSVLLRSFSALSLATIVALDNEAPFLTADEYGEVLRETLRYSRDERDLRGFDREKGWIHSVAHTADLLKFLARSRHLKRSGQRDVLAAISAKLTAAPDVFTHGEDERLARAILSVAARDDFDTAGFREWLQQATTLPRLASLPTTRDLAARQNVKEFVMSLHAVLSVDSRETASLRSSREIVVETLRRVL